MKTICEAIIDEIHYPIGRGLVENILIKRGLISEREYTKDIALSSEFKGAIADCLRSLLYSVNFSEADKSVGALSSEDKKNILRYANSLYASIGEEIVITDDKPKVYIGY